MENIKNHLHKEVPNKYSYPVLIFIVLVFAIIIYFAFSNSKTKRNENEGRSSTTSYPSDSNLNNVSYVSESAESSVVGMEFVNEDLFNKQNYSDLNYQFCITDKVLPVIPIDLVRFDTETEDIILGRSGVYLFKNMSTYINNDAGILGAYELFKQILNGEFSIQNPPVLKTIKNAYPKSCVGDSEGMTSLGYLKEINYQGADNAYLIIYFGKTQSSHVNKEYFPLYSTIIAKKDDDYASFNLSLKYSDISKQNTLDQCEFAGDDGYKDIDTKTEEGINCVRRVLDNDLDQSKIDSVMDHFNELYELKN
jgi:hypothetical protein